MKKKNKTWLFQLIFISVILILINSCKKDKDNETITPTPANGNTVTDIDGNVYHKITIGTQVWMVENLKVTKYNDGSVIAMVTDDATWLNLTTAGYCWFENNASVNKNTYGALYNWYAVNSGKLCPAGWHVPSDSEWTTLTNFLGGDSIAGGKLKESGTTHWINPNTGATNSSGFTALPGSGRSNSYNGAFDCCTGDVGYWWSSTESYPNLIRARWIDVSSIQVYAGSYPPQKGNSVRCIKD